MRRRSEREDGPWGARALVGLAAIGYRPRATPLHAARPAVAAAWCGALVLLAMAVSHPVLQVVVLATVLLAGARVGAAAAQRRVVLLAIPFAVVLVVIQVLIYREGLTVLARLGTVPVLGSVDVTLEALVASLVVSLRLVLVVTIVALAATAVDPDRLLMALRRRLPAAALTSALALRIVPVLARDAGRMADARRCRPLGVPGARDDPGARLLVARAVTASALERAGDLSATLELRGHGLRIPPAPRSRRSERRSRHDLALGASATLLLVAGAVGVLSGAAMADTSPELVLPSGPLTFAVSGVLPVLVLLPLGARRGTGT
jgi:energy-coupling factor transport system permease protein